MSTIGLSDGFHAVFEGPEGRYVLSYAPDENGGLLLVTVGDSQMGWPVEVAESNGNDACSLEGMTAGSIVPWGDTYWFKLARTADVVTVQLWGDQILVREDAGKVVEHR